MPALPDRLMAGRLFLVQSVVVRIHLGQRLKSNSKELLFYFMPYLNHIEYKSHENTIGIFCQICFRGLYQKIELFNDGDHPDHVHDHAKFPQS